MLEFSADSFFELAGVLAGLLSQDPPEKVKIKKLYSHIEQTYISAMRGAILDKHPQWCVQGHQRAAEIYLYQNWPHGETGRNLVSKLNMLVDQMKSDFLPSEGEQLSVASIESILSHLDQQDRYSEKVLKPCVDKRDAAQKRRDKVKQCAENPKIIANKRRKKLDISKQPPVSKNLRTKDAKSAIYGRSKLAIRLSPK